MLCLFFDQIKLVFIKMMQKIKQYQIIDYISKGSFGTVYKATYRGNNYAIKEMIDPSLLTETDAEMIKT